MYCRTSVPCKGIYSNITDYRVVITTTQGQIYHNKPNRSVVGTDLPLADDYLLFEESVIWDMPHRRLPSKTSDAFPYVKNPCLPETCYTTFHPVLNTDSGFTDTYGNGGFGISKSGRPRMYIPEYNYTVNPFLTMGGVVIQNAKLVLGTYFQSVNQRRKMCCVRVGKMDESLMLYMSLYSK